MEKALQLMQQQHKRTNDNNATDLAVRLKGSPKLPSSKDLLAIEIPDTQAPLSLFQGFHASYPAYSSHGVISKHHIRRKKHAGPDKRRGSVSDKGKGWYLQKWHSNYGFMTLIQFVIRTFNTPETTKSASGG
jgi:hypothetical protein